MSTTSVPTGCINTGLDPQGEANEHLRKESTDKAWLL